MSTQTNPWETEAEAILQSVRSNYRRYGSQSPPIDGRTTTAASIGVPMHKFQSWVPWNGIRLFLSEITSKKNWEQFELDKNHGNGSIGWWSLLKKCFTAAGFGAIVDLASPMVAEAVQQWVGEVRLEAAWRETVKCLETQPHSTCLKQMAGILNQCSLNSAVVGGLSAALFQLVFKLIEKLYERYSTGTWRVQKGELQDLLGSTIMCFLTSATISFLAQGMFSALILTLVGTFLINRFYEWYRARSVWRIGWEQLCNWWNGQREEPSGWNEDGVDIPPSLQCPISGGLFYDPVVLADGVFERKYIEDWIERKGTHPISRDLRASFTMLRPCHEMRDLAHRFAATYQLTPFG